MQHRIPLTERQLSGSFIWALISLLGWTLFIYWWGAVFDVQQPWPLFRLLLFLIIICTATLITTFSWIWHNVRIARRGRRGMAAAYRPAIYEKDALGRAIIVTEPALLRSASVIVVTADDTTKTFTPEARPTT